MSEVKLVNLEPAFIAAVRRKTTFAELPRQIRSYYDVVYAAVQEGKISKGGHNVAVYRNASERSVDVEAGVQVPSKFVDVGEVECRQLPGGEAATLAHFGPYDRLASAHEAVRAWVRQHGRVLSGVAWEIYGDWDDDPAKVRTDVFYGLAPA